MIAPLKTSLQSLASTVSRFPLPAIFSIAFCAVFICMVHEYTLYSNYLPVLFCGFFWFLGFKLLTESRKWGYKFYYAASIPIFLAMAAWILNTKSMLSFLYLGLFLSIFIAPFLSRKPNSMQLWAFSYHVWVRIFLAALATLILWLGASAILASLHPLFDIRFDYKIYLDAISVAAFLFAPIFTMADIPERFDISRDKYPQVIRLILSYILVPLLLIYSLILYVYIAKIIVMWSLPNGGVAYLVSAFGCAGVIVYLACYPLKEEMGIIRFYNRYFFKILLAPMALLALAIGLRIFEYGVTESRYAILLCLIWLMLSGMSVLLYNNEHAPKLIVLSAVVLLITASFGPWSAYNMSGNSQAHRLKLVLEKNHILPGKPAKRLDDADRHDITSIMQYMVNTHKTEFIKPWLGLKVDGKSADTILHEMGIGAKRKHKN